MIDLTDKSIFDEIKKKANDALIEDDTRRGLIFVRNVQKLLRAKENKGLANFPRMRAEYERLIALLSHLSLAGLTDKEIAGLLEENLLVALKSEYLDLVAKATAKLISLASFEERDILRRKMREALLRNNELISQADLKEEDKTLPPSIGNWLRLYSAQVGPGPVNSAVSNEFLASNPQVKKLAEPELLRLRKLINFFEFLKESSQTPQGLEDPVAYDLGDGIRILNKGNFETVKLPASVQKMVDEMFPGQKPKTETDVQQNISPELQTEVLTVYQGDAKQQKTIANFQDKLKKTAGNDPFKLREEFYKGVQNQDLVKTVACLKLLSLNGQLLDFIKNDAKLNKFLAATWAKTFGQALAAEFVKNPGQPKFVRLFLKYVLSDRLKMSESDAGRIAMQIGNVFAAQGQPEYNRLAYLDVGSKQFRWFEN